MCGICGVLASAHVRRDDASAMLEALRNRGPDDGDLWQDQDAGISLGHRRLAVLELSPAGRQPMTSHDGRYVITFNGEIYNHPELRGELVRAGALNAWRGHSDTETLLECVSAWGVRRTLDATVGMFAFALWDRVERRLHLARDRFGTQPRLG